MLRTHKPHKGRYAVVVRMASFIGRLIISCSRTRACPVATSTPNRLALSHIILMGANQLGLNFDNGRSGIRTQGQMVMSHPLAYRRAQRPKGIGVRHIAVGYCFTVAWPTEHHQPCIQHSRTKSVSYMAHEAPSSVKLGTSGTT